MKDKLKPLENNGKNTIPSLFPAISAVGYFQGHREPGSPALFWPVAEVL